MPAARRTDAPAGKGAAPPRPLSELMDRQPPFDLQAEIGVLGSIVLLPDVLDDVILNVWEQVPEPSVAALGIVFGAMALGRKRFGRRTLSRPSR